MKAKTPNSKKITSKSNPTEYRTYHNDVLIEVSVRNGVDVSGSCVVDTNILKRVEFKSPANQLYLLLASLTGDNSNQALVSLKELAILFDRTESTTRKWLKFLVEKGIVEEKAPDFFIVHDGYRDRQVG